VRVSTEAKGAADWEDSVRAVVNCRACKLATALLLLADMICKCSINTITNPYPVYKHSYKRQYITSGGHDIPIPIMEIFL
jgi:hypothetical protein